MARLINNYTIFMTKPWCSSDVENSAIRMLEDFLVYRGKIFKREFFRREPILSREFWEEFYKSLRGWGKFEKMIDDFATLERGPIVTSYSGGGITKIVKEILGPTHYEANRGEQTIRGVFGNSEDVSWRNIAHAPKPEEVEENLRVLKKYSLI